MTRADFVRAGRWAAVLMATAALAACATPQYAVRKAPGGGLGGGPVARGSTVRPPSNGRTGTMAPYQVGGIWYVPHEQPDYDQTGVASWYGEQFNMKATADGEIFDLNQFSAAHTTLPLPCLVEVTNLDNGRKLVVRVNDRGPFVGGRIIDLSQAAARELGYERAGIAHVRVRYVGPAPLGGPDATLRYAKASPPPAAAYPASRTPAIVPVSAPVSGRRPADEEIFAQAGPAYGGFDAAPRPLVAPPAPVAVASLAPLPQARPSRAIATPDLSPAAGPDTAPMAPASGLYRIQAGAFGDQDNARRAAAQLSAFGTATVEPIQRGGTTLYRVTVPGPADEAEAYGVRDKVAAAGFSDARVLRPQPPLQ